MTNLGTTRFSVSLLSGGHPTQAESTTSQDEVAGTFSTVLVWEASRSVQRTKVAWRVARSGGWPWGVWVTQPHASRWWCQVAAHSCCHDNSTPERREARQTGLFALCEAEGESPGHRGGQGLGREQTWENGRLRKPVEGGGHLLQGTGRQNNGRNRPQVEGTDGEGEERIMDWEGEQV